MLFTVLLQQSRKREREKERKREREKERKRTAFSKPRSGFTLVELSIVLVIIGLVVGGVFVGRDLIQAAEIRAQVSQNQQIETAMVTFKLKYNCLAGDCDKATTFFSNVRDGNGNHVICRTSYIATDACDVAHTNNPMQWRSGTNNVEVSWVFDHLASAGLVKLGPYDETNNASNAPGIGFPKMVFQGSGTQASSAYGSVGGVTIQYLQSYLHITAGHKLMMGACGGATWGIWNYCGMKGVEAYQLDSKMDDGFPLTGKVVMNSIHYVYRVPGDVNNEVGGHCNTTGSTNEYNINANGNKDNRYCVLSVNMPF